MITVIGVDGGPLPPRAADALASAVCVAGAPRHLDAVAGGIGDGAERVPIGDLRAATDAVLAARGPAAVLASGDPGFFGVLRSLRSRGADPEVVPAVSSVATAFARIGLPWDDAVVVSAHGRADSGRGVRRALAAALAHPKAAVLTAPGGAGPEAFLPELLRAGREVHVAQRLGSPGEEVVRIAPGDPVPERDWAAPNLVLAVDPERALASAMAWLPGHQGAPPQWALPCDAFEHRASLITKPEVRALALARLAPRPGTVVWDVGAGSGSVAVECARFGARAVAFERNAADCDRIRANALAHGVGVEVHPGEAAANLHGAAARLAPDAAFVGGGDDAVAAAVLAHRPRRVVAALASLDRIRPLHDMLAAGGYTAEGTQLQASGLAGLPSGSLRLAAANPVTVLWGVRRDET
ncbi:precorrin-6y C5,15-methyltransferase (decarboxylating) subunit CbiE [Streptomonospora wellingtoniae]|uniref:Precorrin-6y C5,15-methyltransferase (Decarboxylating) subunit CbiE n=1 Tax=Streptomonospora wellingtoniae TaxID=3075544 RepID=A0ABU2KPS3_9ACTN|nr:precorrin-6y C5,15-methyltransferase (decarboxylating) subunit CbiE [Streptomonospora sp. DSM 45055]MDT0301259.1 precorrin-6y C5,15-methyltransferase (decarboxylating) subunit CbiE [Streptomonospora sp. DSM 45055]